MVSTALMDHFDFVTHFMQILGILTSTFQMTFTYINLLNLTHITQLQNFSLLVALSGEESGCEAELRGGRVLRHD